MSLVKHAVSTQQACFFLSLEGKLNLHPVLSLTDANVVIMQVAGFKRKEGQREQGSESSGGGGDADTPPIHMLAALVHLLLSTEAVMHCEFVHLSLIFTQRRPQQDRD